MSNTRSPSLLIQGADVFDGVEMRRATSVLVRNGIIAAVSDDLAKNAAEQVIDGRGRVVLPGLIDSHVHLGTESLAASLEWGVTTVMDMFTPEDYLSEQRFEAQHRDDVADLRSSGIGATTDDGHPAQFVGAPFLDPPLAPFPTVSKRDQVDDFVQERIAGGSDYLKIFASGLPGVRERPVLSDELVAALIRSAHRMGLLALAHATDQAAALRAVEAGVDGLAHLPFDAPIEAEFVARLAASGTFVVSTLCSWEIHAGSSSDRTPFLNDPRIRDRLSPAAYERLTRTLPPLPGEYDVQHALHAVSLLRAAGVPIVAGSDAVAIGAYGANLHRELELLVQAALTAVQALAAATSVAARAFNLPDRGRIAPGLRADLLIVDGDPSEEITHTRNIVAVVRRGRVLAE